MTFRDAIEAEIKKQEALIDEMDWPRNPEFWGGNGIMTVIRRERLELLEKLLEYEPKSVQVADAP